MRFIVDTNLPPALSEWLIKRGHDAVHTTSVGLAAAPDLEIWRYAVQNEAVIVSKDEDFALLKAAKPDGHPQEPGVFSRFEVMSSNVGMALGFSTPIRAVLGPLPASSTGFGRTYPVAHRRSWKISRSKL